MEPKQTPATSRQNYVTPQAFIDSVVRTFGPLSFDLAASRDNAQAPQWFDIERDSLTQDWAPLRGNLWLNPPFRDAAPWFEKCRATAPHPDRRIIVLSLASIGSCWFADHVHGAALVLGLSPRLTFDVIDEGGARVPCTAPYPKDLMLSVYGVAPGFDVWRWDARARAIPRP